ncbi:hypothetical protein [Halosquirtibacter laminarini]
MNRGILDGDQRFRFFVRQKEQNIKDWKTVKGKDKSYPILTLK